LIHSRRSPHHLHITDTEDCTRGLGDVYREMTADDYRKGLGLEPGYRVDALVVHGCAQEYPVSMMHDALMAAGHNSVLESPVASLPTLNVAVAGAHVLWHARVYGGALACELTHLACVLGAKGAVFIGTCGGLLDGAAAGDHVVPDAVYADESSTRAYAREEGDRLHYADPSISRALIEQLTGAGHTVRRGVTMTHQAQLAESWADILAWQRKGWAGVEMEAASVLAPAAAFSVPAAAVLVIADNLVAGQSVFHPEVRASRAQRHAALAAAYAAVVPVMLARLAAPPALAAESEPVPVATQ
jgi:uridine phosphorylase